MGDDRNFASGRISALNAARIYNWLRTTHPDYARKVFANIGDPAHACDAFATWMRALSIASGKTQAINDEKTET